MLTVEYVEDSAAFASLRPEWNALLRDSAANRVFLTWEWLYTWWRHLRGTRRLKVLTVRRAGELVGILPVAALRPALGGLWPLPRFQSLGTGSVGSDYLDIIARRGYEEPVLDAVAGELLRQGARLHVPQVDMRTALVARLAQSLEGTGWDVHTFGAQACPHIGLAGHTWESYLASLGSDHRYNFRRRLKNLEKTGTFSFDRVTGDEERREVLSVLVRLNHERWQQRGGSQAFHEPGLVAFHDAFTPLALERGWLRLYALRQGGRVAAALYGLLYDGVFSFYQSAFDPRDARHSVGLVAMGLAIKASLEEGAVEYDMLHGDESYKLLWCREQREVAHLELYPATPLGRVAGVAAGALREARRTAGRVLPPQVRTVWLAARSLGRERGLGAAPAR
jgi:CelD/BcsL family acetyltransferase involved in cellulose biosynthesis